MNTFDLVLTKYCPACKWEDVIDRYPSGMKHLTPKYEGVSMSVGRSIIEFRVDLRFICCEKCGNPVMYVRIEPKEAPPLPD